jgi:hypothetical protein
MTLSKMNARQAGIFYLAFVITCIFAGVVRSKLIDLGDASKTAELIGKSMGLFHASFIVDLISGLLFLLAAWFLYVILKPVNENLALLFLLLNATGVAVQCLSLLSLYAPQLINRSLDLQNAFQPNQLRALNLLFLNLHKSGFIIAQIFFGTWLFPLGYLVFKSGFMPKWLGGLLMADGVGVYVWFLQFFVLPEVSMLSYPGLAVSFLAEVSLGVWLLVKGVR